MTNLNRVCKMTSERIKELAKQSGFYFQDAGHSPIEHTEPHEYSEKCFERFAQLIVKECAEAINRLDGDGSAESVGLARAEWTVRALFGNKP